MSSPEHLVHIIKSIPENPGVYQYYDIEEKLIYVGKAKNLKKRVSSYFTKENHDQPKTAILVRKIVDIKYSMYSFCAVAKNAIEDFYEQKC